MLPTVALTLRVTIIMKPWNYSNETGSDYEQAKAKVQYMLE